MFTRCAMPLEWQCARACSSCTMTALATGGGRDREPSGPQPCVNTLFMSVAQHSNTSMTLPLLQGHTSRS